MRLQLFCCLLLSGLLIGCGSKDDKAKGGKEGKSDPDALEQCKERLLSKEPSGIKSVKAVRKPEVKDGDKVIVAGQVGGDTKPFFEGRAGFLLADESLQVTDGCDTPWDFCELPKKEVAAARIAVRFVDGDGKTLKADARKAFGIKELSKVVIEGKVKRDDKGNVVVLASGIYVKSK